MILLVTSRLLLLFGLCLTLFSNPENEGNSSQKDQSIPVWDSPGNVMESVWNRFVNPVYESIYQNVYRQEMIRVLNVAGIDTNRLNEKQLSQIQTYEQMKVPYSTEPYECSKRDGSIEYSVLIASGTGSKQFHKRLYQKGDRSNSGDDLTAIINYALSRPYCKAVMSFRYDDRKTLNIISNRLLDSLQELRSSTKTETVLLFGISAGGIILSDIAARIPKGISSEIFTLAAPLRGYDLNRFGDLLIEEYAPLQVYGKHGFYRQIGLGIAPYQRPGNKVNVTHHKEGKSARHLISYCGQFTGFCNSLKIQSNNVPGSSEFYSKGDLQIERMARKILSCW
ncbi:hypothetical protein HOF92_13255 [bacterium]|jgi:hypothetical protein|nr:hypothetical protein [bacterium]